MYFAEIDENGKCFHITEDELPLSDRILLADRNVIGMVWDGEKWNDPESIPASEPTQLDRIEETLSILTADTVTAESIKTAILEGVNEV